MEIIVPKNFPEVNTIVILNNELQGKWEFHQIFEAKSLKNQSLFWSQGSTD